jgi:CO/xanthine dehydrogenase FAD-binding subunit
MLLSNLALLRKQYYLYFTNFISITRRNIMSDALGYLLRLPKFRHFETKSVKEACSLLSKHKGRAKLIAGGTDLLVSMKKREVAPKYLIDIKGIRDLNYIRYQRGVLMIGAVTPLNEIESSSIIQERFPILASACHQIGTPQVRNLGTIGGNLCNASPSADTAPALIGLGAKVKIMGLKGEKIIPLEKFFVGSGQSVLQDSEMLTEIQVPKPIGRNRGVYVKLPARTAIDIAAVGVAVIVTLGSEDNKIADIKIILGAVAPTPMRARRAEKIMKGKAIEEQLIEKVAQVAAEEARPISDIRGSAEYRKEMVRVLTQRAIRQVVPI